MNPLVSIIIPVFNAEKHITRCMISLLNQSLKEIEVIFVDDKSTDRSNEVIHDFILKNKLEEKWTVIHNTKNCGPGASRNNGIKKAKGCYIAFCDADDWAEHDMYESLYNIAIEKNADIATCNAISHYGIEKKLLTNPDCDSAKTFLCKYKAYIWTFLFKRSFLIEKKIEFPPFCTSEDTFFIAASIMHCKSFTHTNAALYNYQVYNNSISHKKDKKRHLQKISVMTELISYAKNENLISKFRFQLYWIYLKKGVAMAAKEYVKNIF